MDESDRVAARQALERNWPNLESQNPKYAAFLEALAKFHHLLGTDKFELYYNLRPPSDRTEEWAREFMHGQITKEEYGARLKADAERRIDLEMLTSFCDAYQRAIPHYSGVLQKAALKSYEEGSPVEYKKEREIDNHVAALHGKFSLWRQNLETAFEFLEERRITSGKGLVKLGDFEGTSAHWMAELVFTRITEARQSCKEISKRSHADRRYVYEISAIDLFNHQWRTKFPTPQSIRERLREEFILARAELKRTAGIIAVNPSSRLESSSKTYSDEQSIDNESRELVLKGDMFKLVGEAGHIFRPTPSSDWGIDGEIEFKDGAGQASGRRAYVQLKSGDSHLRLHAGDGEEVFTVKNERHLQYWAQQAYPVMLVIRQSSGLIRWMDVSAYLKLNGQTNRQIIFRGESVSIDSIRELAKNSLKISEQGAT